MTWQLWIPKLLDGLLVTTYMVGLSTFFTVLFGLPLGILLFNDSPVGIHPNRSRYAAISTIVNIGRSLPFIILLVAVIPLTRAIVGTSIGAKAAIVPLALAAIPFFARVVETALAGVDHGLIEAGLSMGASSRQLITKVLIPEAMSALIAGVALTVISLVGYSAMAGAIGGGGLGDLAIRYGYQRFETPVMIATVFLLVLLVQGIQALGTYLANKASRH